MTDKAFSSNGHKQGLLYGRVSHEEQSGEGKASIPEQLAEMHGRCNLKENKWNVIGEFVDDKDYKATQNPKRGKVVNPSGERADRPQFLAMLEVVKSGTADFVMCWRDDRLVRHPRVASALEDALDLGDKARGNKPKIQIFDATGAEIDRFVLHIKAVIGREENKRRVERVRIGKVGTLKAHRWPGNYTRLGYATVKDPTEKLRGVEIVLADKDEVQTVKDIFNWYDAGLPVVELRDRLIQKGAQQKKGYKRHEWNPALIDNILKAKEYTGKLTWHFDNGAAHTIDIPQIIAPDQWERVQQRMHRNKVLSTRNAEKVYLLQGIARCGECKATVEVAKSRTYHGHKRKDGTYYNWRVLDRPIYRYRCSQAACYAHIEEHARPYSWSGEKLDWAVWRFVVDKGIKHPELIRERILTRQAELQAQGENVDGDIAHARQKFADVEQERANYQRQNARGKISDDEFDLRIQETDDTRRHWQEELARLTELRDNTSKVNAGLDYVTNLMIGLQERLPEIDLEPDVLKALPVETQDAILLQRQKIIRALCDKVTIKANGHVEIEGLLDGSEAAQFELASLWTDYLKLTWQFQFDLVGGLFAQVGATAEV